MRSIVIGTAGHIDHGKTTLLKALTGIDPSRLSEEKRRGITIDLGFAFRDVQAVDGSSLRLSFVDVPGHSAFIRNMLAGAGGIDMVLLVISAEEGVKPQTKEHLAICSLLGVRRGLAVLTKADAATPEKLMAVRGEVSLFLKESFLENAQRLPLPVSARTGAGLPELLQEIVALASQIDSRDASGLVRLPIDRSFSMRGFGTVVTGTLLSGSIEVEQKLVIEPRGRGVRIRGIQMHGQNYQRAVAGSRVALNLAGIDHSSIARGDTIVAPETLAAVDVVDTEITLLPDAAPLKHGSLVTFHAYTSDCVATVLLYGRSTLEPRSKAFARLKLRQPVVLAPGNRFILRLPSPSETIGGGIVFDAHPLARQSRPDALRWLQSLQEANGLPEVLLHQRTRRRQWEGLGRATAVRETGMTQVQLDEVFGQCVRSQRLAPLGSSQFVDRVLYDSALRQVENEIAKHHARSPELDGIRRADLQSRSGLPAAVFASVLDELLTRMVVKSNGDVLSAFGFVAQPNANDSRGLALLASFYKKAGLETPSLSGVAALLRTTEGETRRLVAVLVKEKVLVKIGNDAYVHRDRLAELRLQLTALRGKTLDVAQFKELSGLSRKHAIPWLEYLDREHITRRVGDARVVL
jgi:selenocysteine-specific elongation factor